MPGEIHGSGVLSYLDGDSYDGQWTQGRMDGRGVFVENEGSRYDGRWLNGKRHGYGTFTSGNGDMLEKYEGGLDGWVGSGWHVAGHWVQLGLVLQRHVFWRLC